MESGLGLWTSGLGLRLQASGYDIRAIRAGRFVKVGSLDAKWQNFCLTRNRRRRSLRSYVPRRAFFGPVAAEFGGGQRNRLDKPSAAAKSWIFKPKSCAFAPCLAPDCILCSAN